MPGAGAAGIACARLLLHAGVRDLVAALPADGAVNPRGLTGGLAEALTATMAPEAIVFAVANPVPEILPDEVPPNVASVFDRRVAPAVSRAVQETVERAGLSRLVESG